MIVYDMKSGKTSEERESLILRFLYNTVIGRCILKVIIQRPISRFNSFFINSRISSLFIKSFIRNNNIDMDDYEDVKYYSFNSFFTRKIKDGRRSISSDLFSICDSKLMYYKISSSLKIKVKNSVYSLDELVKGDVSSFGDGVCLVFRLSPEDYHHYLFLDSGKVVKSYEIDGILHSVNPIVYDRYKVFSENNRVVNYLDTFNYGSVIEIEVGALNIGKINNYEKADFKRGEEKGYFSFGGSTIILLFKKDTVLIDDLIVNNSSLGIETRVLMGDKIGKKL